jgi:hypothetical protein
VDAWKKANGGKGREVQTTWIQYLPFPDAVGETRDRRRVSKETARIFLGLEAQGLIPVQVIGAASELLGEMESVTSSQC